MSRLLTTASYAVFLAVTCTSLYAESPPARPDTAWHHDLYLDGGGYWKARVWVTVRNRSPLERKGYPLPLTVGSAPNALPLAGERAEGVRVCKPDGTELRFGIWSPDGLPIAAGPIPPHSRLVIPIDVAPSQTAHYYVYFDNPDAGKLPDYLPDRPVILNGDLERGDGRTPLGWIHDRPAPGYRVEWTTETARSGRHSLKTSASPEAKPSWTATRQNNIRVVGGATYRFEGWVKARDVKGNAGWYIHVGNAANPMLMGPVLSAGGGTYDWKRVEFTFTAPPEADRVSVGTVLRGSGTAWFDDARLEQLTAGPFDIQVAAVERLILREPPRHLVWPYGDPRLSSHDIRGVVHIMNTEDAPQSGIAAVETTLIERRLKGNWNRNLTTVLVQDRHVPSQILGNLLLFENESPPRSIVRADVYLSTAQGTPDSPENPGPGLTEEIARADLVKNGSFETGSPLPDHWTTTGNDGFVSYALETGDHLSTGGRSARIAVRPGAPDKWRGWTQRIRVMPGRSYLVAARVRCQDVPDDVRIHVHLRTEDGRLAGPAAIQNIGPPIKGTTDWQQLSGVVTTPPGAAFLEVHLTTNTTGTIWYDDVHVIEVQHGRIVRFEGAPVRTERGIVAWQVPAIVKVFPEDAAPSAPHSAWIAAARNEREPLQLAVRSARHLKGVQIALETPVGPGSHRIPDAEIGVVRYVPVDFPSQYYVSHEPAWIRHRPRGNPGCDGWPGLWPDPIEPRATLDLEPNTTRSIWITFTIPHDVPPGDYHGKVRLLHESEPEHPLLEVPFTLHVWDFELPEETHIAAIYDIRFGPGGKHWGFRFEELYRKVTALMARRRLCPDRIWPDPEFHLQAGEIVVDFEQYDRAAREYFERYRFPVSYAPRIFYSFGWGFPPKPLFGVQPYPGAPPFEGIDRGQLLPEYKELYQTMLRRFWQHAQQEGWADRLVLYVSDEPLDRLKEIRDQLQAVCKMIHEVDGSIPIYSSTWHFVPDWEGHLNIWGLGHDGRVPPEQLAKIRAGGARIWFTTDGQMCLDTPYAAVERLLPHYCFKYDVEAYEFWGCTWFTYDPWSYGWHAYIDQSMEPGRSHWIRYPNGDGYLLYPGKPIGHDGVVTSVRFEQASEGVEDYEYLYMLRELVGAAREAGRDDLANLGEKALEQAMDLVEIPNAGGRYSTKILPDPERLYRIRKQLGDVIEQLKRSLSP